MAHQYRIWHKECEDILLNNWERLTLQEIADLVNNQLNVLKKKGRDIYSTCTAGSVLWKALRINLITKQEFDSRESNLRKDQAKRRYIKASIREKVFSIYNRKCAYCLEDNDLHIDHKIPVSQGGDSTIENLQILCRECNLIKGVRTHSEEVKSQVISVKREKQMLQIIREIKIKTEINKWLKSIERIS